jgi:hypothetical protein
MNLCYCSLKDFYCIIVTLYYIRRADKRDAYSILVGKPEGRRPYGRARHRWEDNIKIVLRDLGWGMDWIDLAQDRGRWRALVNAVMNLRVPSMHGIS